MTKNNGEKMENSVGTGSCGVREVGLGQWEERGVEKSGRRKLGVLHAQWKTFF